VGDSKKQLTDLTRFPKVKKKVNVNCNLLKPLQEEKSLTRYGKKKIKTIIKQTS